MTVVERAGKRLAELDAGGIAIVNIRCSSVQDIRAVVETYVHQNMYVWHNEGGPLKVETKERSNMYEVSPTGTVVPYEDVKQEKEAKQFEEELYDFLNEPHMERKYRMFYIPDIRRFETNNAVLDRMKDFSRLKSEGKSRILFVIGCTNGHICSELAAISHTIDLDYPDMEEIREIVKEMYLECVEYPNLSTLDYVLNDIAGRFRGFHREKIRSTMLLAYARCEDPIANEAEGLKAEITESKIQLLKNAEGLRLLEETDAEVGGLEALRKWAERRIYLYHNYAAAKVHRVSMPKGVLVTGIPGTGKTLMARWFVGQMKLPALQLDMGAIVGKYLGESEERFERAIRLVEATAPCVLFIDELEKAFDGVGGDSEEGSNSSLRRIFARFLGWLQDADKREAPVFVFATANNATLPPEFLRKGRFDEKFYSFMPGYEECRKILKVHLKKHEAVIRWEMPEGAGWEAQAAAARIAEEIEAEKDRRIDAQIVAPFMLRAAALEKFMTGADMESIVTEAFQYLFVEGFQSKETDRKAAALGICDSMKVSLSEICETLCEVLEDTRVYSETDMDNIVSCWMGIWKKRTKSVSADKPLLDFNRLNPKTGMFRMDGGSPNAEAYENMLEAKRAELIGQADSAGQLSDSMDREADTGLHLYDAVMRTCLQLEIFRSINGR